MEGTLYQKGWMSFEKRHYCVEEEPENGELCLVGRIKTREGKVDKKIPLASLEAIEAVDETTYEFIIIAGATTLNLRVETRAEFAQWVNGLRAVVGMPDIEFAGAAGGAVQDGSTFAGGLSEANRTRPPEPPRALSPPPSTMSPPPGYQPEVARPQRLPPAPAAYAAGPPPRSREGGSCPGASAAVASAGPLPPAYQTGGYSGAPAAPRPALPPAYPARPSPGAMASRYGVGAAGCTTSRYPVIGGAAAAAAVATAPVADEPKLPPPPAYQAGAVQGEQRWRPSAAGGTTPGCGDGGRAESGAPHPAAAEASRARAPEPRREAAGDGKAGDASEMSDDEWLEETWLAEVEPEVIEAAQALGIRVDVRAERRHLWIAQLYALEPLPAGWSKQTDAKGRAYYFHAETRQSRWRPPAYEAHRAILEAQHAAATQLDARSDGAAAQRARRFERAMTLAAMERDDTADDGETEEEAEALDESMQLAFHQLLTAGFFRVDDGTYMFSA